MTPDLEIIIKVVIAAIISLIAFKLLRKVVSIAMKLICAFLLFLFIFKAMG